MSHKDTLYVDLILARWCVPLPAVQARHADRDEKRHLSKLTLVEDVSSPVECREITKRFDLEPGTYFLVPYTLKAGNEGEFLLRVLGQKEEMPSKNGWLVLHGVKQEILMKCFKNGDTFISCVFGSICYVHTTLHAKTRVFNSFVNVY